MKECEICIDENFICVGMMCKRVSLNEIANLKAESKRLRKAASVDAIKILIFHLKLRGIAYMPSLTVMEVLDEYDIEYAEAVSKSITEEEKNERD